MPARSFCCFKNIQRTGIFGKIIYGVNAGLKGKVQKFGLDLGGEFQNHESTTWTINGTF